MNEFDPNHLNKDFSDQPITSLSDLAKRMRGPQYRSSLASQDARPFEQRAPLGAVGAGGVAEASLVGHGPETAHGWQGENQAEEQPVPAASDANLFDAPALQEDSYAWQEAASDLSMAAGFEEPTEAMGFPETVEAETGMPIQHATEFDQPASHEQSSGDASEAQWDARAIDEEFSDLSPDSREWQKVAWHQEGPVAGHLVTGQLRGSKRADLRAALNFDYAAEDDADQQAYAPSYRPAAPIPGFARSQHEDGHQTAGQAQGFRQDQQGFHQDQFGEQHDLRAVGEALAAERHSAKQASIGYRAATLAMGTWRACRAASVPQIAVITGGVAASVVMALAIWTLLSEPSLREPVYIAAQEGPEKTIPEDPGGMQIANLDVSLLNDGAQDGSNVRIRDDGSTPAIALSLQRGQQDQSAGDLESIDDLIQVEQGQSLVGSGKELPLQDAASIDQLIELASLDGSNAALLQSSVEPFQAQQQSLVFDGPPLPRRKEAGHGMQAQPGPETVQTQAPPATSLASNNQPLAQPEPLLPLPAPGTVSAAAPLSKQDDLGALVEEMNADPIWQLMLQEQLAPAQQDGDLGEGETPAQSHPEETPAAILSGSIDPNALQEARVDLEAVWALDDGLHSQASMLGNFANWIVPSARKVGEQLAQLRADGQGGLVGAQELPPEPQQQSATADDEVVVPDGPWAPPLLPGEAIEPFGLQLASYRSLNSARRSWVKFKDKHPSLLKDLVLRVQQVQLAGRGTFYRLQVGPFPNELTALDVCEQLKERGHRSCIVVK